MMSALPAYAAAKKLKATSVSRYESMLRIHFGEWKDVAVTELAAPAFYEHCQHFAATNGNAIVEVGRGLIGALIKYFNAVHGLALESPFDKLAAAGLLPDRSQPRARRLQERDLPAWYVGVQKLPDEQRDYLMLLVFTGLRRNEGSGIRPEHIDWQAAVLHIPETKTSVPHTLPLTTHMLDILKRRTADLEPGERLFAKVAPDHVAGMAHRRGAPLFMLHDLRKLHATVGEQGGHGDAVLRRILNHKAKRADTLHRHYVSLSAQDVLQPLQAIQDELLKRMTAPVSP